MVKSNFINKWYIGYTLLYINALYLLDISKRINICLLLQSLCFGYLFSKRENILYEKRKKELKRDENANNS